MKFPSDTAKGLHTRVALFTRAWIEITTGNRSAKLLWSPSSRGRGLKSFPSQPILRSRHVALFTRAWIEIACICRRTKVFFVALFTRAWIEIARADFLPDNLMSPSSRGRGLKFRSAYQNIKANVSPSSRGRGLK